MQVACSKVSLISRERAQFSIFVVARVTRCMHLNKPHWNCRRNNINPHTEEQRETHGAAASRCVVVFGLGRKLQRIIKRYITAQ